METGSITQLANPQASARQEQAPTSGSLDREAFMKLLVAQLSNQDPLDPMDSREMVSQLSELTSVEQLVAIEGRVQSLEVGLGGIANTQVSSLVGKTVTAAGDTMRISDTGVAEGGFTLGRAATDTVVTIRDANGELVRTMDLGAMGVGPQEFTWDGIDASGERVAAGRYSISVEAEADGVPVGVQYAVTGLVEAVSYTDGIPVLQVGSRNILLGDVESISR